MKEIEKAWLAGIIDADGSINLGVSNRNEKYGGLHFQPAIQVTNKNTELLNRINEIIGTSYILKRNHNDIPCFDLHICKREIIKNILINITPYLIVKRRQSKLMIDFIDSCVGRQAKYTESLLSYHLTLKEEMSYLNKRG